MYFRVSQTYNSSERLLLCKTEHDTCTGHATDRCIGLTQQTSPHKDSTYTPGSCVTLQHEKRGTLSLLSVFFLGAFLLDSQKKSSEGGG